MQPAGPELSADHTVRQAPVFGMPEPPPLVEQHPAAAAVRKPRKRTLLTGKLVYGCDGEFTLDCIIQNISETGAKVIIDDSQSLPSKVYLIAVKQRMAYHADVVWQRYPARGLKFTQTHPLDATLPRELQFLRRLWGELGQRSGTA